MATTDDLLDLAPGVGQRAATFRFDVVDRGGAVIGQVQPDSSSVPVVENNINRSIKRDLRNLVLTPADEAAIDPVSDRIRPVMVLENGAQLPMGLFLFVEASTEVHGYGRTGRGSLVDQNYILDQPVATSVGYGAGAGIGLALEALFGGAGIGAYDVDASGTIANPIAWPAGTSRLQIMNDLAAMAGCYSVYFDNAGVGRVRPVPDLAETEPTVRYEAGRNIFEGSIIETDNLLDSPNRYIVIDSSATENPIVGVYDVPDDAPHSIPNRGFVVARVIEEQGLENVAAANARARAAAAQSAADFKWVTFDGPPDPRHDTFDIIEFLGIKHREQRWVCPLIEGAAMTHDLRRVY